MTGYGSLFDPKALKELPSGSFYTDQPERRTSSSPAVGRNPGERERTVHGSSSLLTPTIDADVLVTNITSGGRSGTRPQ